MATVYFDEATRRFSKDDAPAVDGITLDIADGEFLVLVGPSGCGKSTTLRMLAGLEPIDGGRILVDGHDQKGVRPRDRDIAMVFQSYALYPNMTAAQNMAFALDNAKVSKAETRQRVTEAAKILELEQLLDRKPGQMSGGQRQRVAMGRAIVRNPKVFCMDEPLSNLDAKLRVSTRSQIAGLQRRLGITTVYVTHDQVEAMTMGHRVAVLRDGRLQQVDTPERLYDRPVNTFVAAFIGSPAITLVESVVREGVARVHGVDVPLDRAVAGRAGEKVVVGLRPESWHVVETPERGADATSLALNVELVESLGAESFVYGRPVDADEGCGSRHGPPRQAHPPQRSVTSCTSSPTKARCTSSTPRRASGSRPEMSAPPRSLGLRPVRRRGPSRSQGPRRGEHARQLRGRLRRGRDGGRARRPAHGGRRGRRLARRGAAAGEVPPDRARPRRGPGRRPDVGAAAHGRRGQPDAGGLPGPASFAGRPDLDARGGPGRRAGACSGRLVDDRAQDRPARRGGVGGPSSAARRRARERARGGARAPVLRALLRLGGPRALGRARPGRHPLRARGGGDVGAGKPVDRAASRWGSRRTTCATAPSPSGRR